MPQSTPATNVLMNMSAYEMAEAVRGKHVTSLALTQAHIERIQAINGQLNAVIHPLFEDALRHASKIDARIAAGDTEGRLLGVPMTIKEQYLLIGTPTTLGLGSAPTSFSRLPVLRQPKRRGT